jgi:hypothetical protein
MSVLTSVPAAVKPTGIKPATCHPSRKVQARGMCKNCYDKWLKATNPSYKNRQMSNSTQWARKNPERMALIQENRQKRDKAKPDYKSKQRDKTLSKYGLTQESYATLLASQGNSCALCFRIPSLTKFHVDHNPKGTFKDVRGILCHQCNWYLGVIDNDPTILDRIKTYRGAR